MKLSCLLIALVVSMSFFPGGLAFAPEHEAFENESEEALGSSSGDDGGPVIHLRYAEFDPLDGEPDVPRELKAKDPGVLLVQLEGPTTQESYDELSRQGDVLGYLQEYTYLVFSEDANAIRGLPFVRWVGPYHPAYKVDSSLLDIQGKVDVDVKLFWNLDLPSELTRQIEEQGAEILFDGSVNRVVTVSADLGTITRLAHLPWVEWLEEAGEKTTLMDNIRVYTDAEELHTIPFDGTGVVGEIKDNGIDQDHVEFEGQLIGTDGNVVEESHGTATFGIVFARGDNPRAEGMASGSGGVFCDWSVQRYQSIRNLVNNWDGVFQSNSWYQGATDGTYSVLSWEDDQAIQDYDIIMLYATGNGGASNSCSQDAVAKNVIAVGGIRHADNADWEDDRHTGGQGNRGPAADGRVKPDLCGPYESIYTTRPGSYTSSFGGTSGATPVNAGGISLIYQMYEENHFGNNPLFQRPHASTVKAIAIANAHQYDLDKAERYAQGWGHIDVGRAYHVGKDHLILDEEYSLQTGGNQEFDVKADPGQPLKISLVWTDVPGNPATTRALVNDLDLTVTSPSGTVYSGNLGLNISKWSTPGTLRDDLNNVENVFIQSPEKGSWSIEVSGAQVAMDGDYSTIFIDQPFSLVVSGIYEEIHDLSLLNIDVPVYYEPGKEAELGATVANLGNEEETNLAFQFRLDSGVVEEHIIPTLLPGETSEMNFHWTPTEERNHELQLHVVPVNGESRLFNNWYNESIRVFIPKGKVLVDVLHGRPAPGPYLRELMQIDLQLYHSEEELTSGAFEGMTGMMAFQPDEVYSSEELDAIQAFVEDGGGLLAVAGQEEAIMEELTAFASVAWSTTDGLDGVTDEVADHEVTTGVDTLNFGVSDLTIEASDPAVPIVWDEDPQELHVLVAVTEVGEGHVVVVSELRCLDELLYEEQNLVFGMNAAGWVNNEMPSVIINSPAVGGLFTSDEQIAFSAEITDPDSTDHTVLWNSDIEGEFGTEQSFQASLTTGIHHITVEIADERSNDTDSVILMVNDTAEISLLAPGEGIYLEGGAVNFSWRATDPEDDELVYALELVSGGDTTRHSGLRDDYLETEDLVVGRDYRWRVAARDPYDREVWSTEQTFRYGNNPPVVSPKAPSSEERVPVLGTTLEWSGSDQDGDEFTYSLYFGPDTPQLVYQGDESSYETGALLESEEYSWWVEAEDDHDTGSSNVMSFTVNTLPAVAERSPETGERFSGQATELMLEAKDDDGDDVSISLFISDGNPAVIARERNRVDELLSGLSPGSYTWWAELDDGLDVVTTELWTVVVNTPPTVTLEEPANTGKAEKSLVFRWTGDDDEGDDILYNIHFGPTTDPPPRAELQDTEYQVELTPRRYYWRVTAWDGLDESTSPTWYFIIPPDQPPEPEIELISPETAEYGEMVYFQGMAEDPDGSIVSVEWSSDIDGVLSQELSFQLSSLSEGTHEITFTVTDDDGYTEYETSFLTVQPPPAEPPVAVLEVSSELTKVGEYVSFDLSGSHDPDGTVRYYFVDFGDGSDSRWTRSSLIEHEYTTAGEFTATARVKDNEDIENTGTVSVTIVVQESGTGGGGSDDSLGEKVLSPAGMAVLSLGAGALLVGIFLLRRPGDEDHYADYYGENYEDHYEDYEDYDEDHEDEDDGEEGHDEAWEDGDEYEEEGENHPDDEYYHDENREDADPGEDESEET